MAALLSSLVGILSIAGGGLVLENKPAEQRKRDRQRITYRLTFPAQVEPERVAAYFDELSGILRPRTSTIASLLRLSELEQAFQSIPSIVLEMRGTEAGYSWYLKVPFGYESPVRMRLESLIPGIQLKREAGLPARPWRHATDLRLHYGHRPLKIGEPVHKSVSLRSAFSDVVKDEELALQLVVTPMRAAAKPDHESAKTVEWGWKSYINGGKPTRDEINDRRDKLDQTNMMIAVRIAAVANTDVRASYMVNNVRSAFDSSAHTATYFTASAASLSRLRERVNRASTPTKPQVQLTALELACFTGWPLGDLTTAGQPSPASLRRPVPSSVSSVARDENGKTTAIVLGEGNYSGRERPVTLGIPMLSVHQHLVAPPGKGKTVMLANEAKQIMEAGLGLIILESKGDLFNAVLDYVPPERMHDVVILDLNDTLFPVAWNPLDQGSSSVAIGELIGVFKQWYSEHSSLWAPEVMHHGMHALAAYKKATLIDLMAVMTPLKDEVDWAYAVRNSVRDHAQRRWWQDFENSSKADQMKKVGPLASRFWPLTQSRLVSVLGQEKSAFQMRDIIRQNKILLVNLSGIEPDAATLMGTLIVSAVKQAAWEHPMPHSPNVLMMDEAHAYMNLPLDLQLLLVEARSKGLAMAFAHQGMWQLPPAMKQAINISTQTKIVFQTSGDDTRELAKVLGNPISDHDISSLGQYEAIARVATPSGMSSPLTMMTSPPAKGYGKAQQIIYASRGRYGTPVNKVMDEMIERRKVDSGSSKRRMPPKRDTPY
jgi:hypothetical protein